MSSAERSKRGRDRAWRIQIRKQLSVTKGDVNLRRTHFLFSFLSQSKCELNFGSDFKVPGFNLAWVPVLASFTLCFPSSRLSEFKKAGGREFLRTEIA